MPAGSFAATIARHGHLVAGVDQNTLLLAYRNPRDAQFEGFEIDILHEVAPYFAARQGLLVPSDSVAQSIGALRGRRVCATIGSTSIENVMRHPGVIPYPVAQRTDCLVALQEGAVDGIASDDAILRGFAAQDPYTRLVTEPRSPAPYGIAISLDHPDFVRFINGVLARIRADGTWRRIYAKWFGTPAPPPPTPRYAG
jgi:polar amino acid transport system substrate-binding protein